MHKKIILNTKIGLVIFTLLFAPLFTQEMEVDGDLRVTGKIIFNDSTSQQTAAQPSVPGMNGLAEFTNSTTWTVPEGITRLRVQLIGGGGSGGNNRLNSSCYNFASGGGAGAYVHCIITVVPGNILTINVGSGGVLSETAAYTDGIDGTASDISDENGTILAIANGGSGGGSPGWASGGIGEHTGVGIIHNGADNEGSNEGALRDKTYLGEEYGYGGKGSYPHPSNNFCYPAQSGGDGYVLLFW